MPIVCTMSFSCFIRQDLELAICHQLWRCTDFVYSLWCCNLRICFTWEAYCWVPPWVLLHSYSCVRSFNVFTCYQIYADIHMLYDIRLHQKWHCSQSWANGSDAVLTCKWGDEPFYLFVDRLLDQSTNFRNFFFGIFRWIAGCCLQYYRFHSLCGLSSFCTFCRFLVLDKTHNQALKFQDLNLTMKFDVFRNSLKVRI